MGTTLDALGSGPGVRLGWSIAIEGYDTIVCDTEDTSAVVTAWGSTDWSQAIGGLVLSGNTWEQSIEPWATRVKPNRLTLKVQDWDGSDTFGTAVFKRAGGNATELTAEIDANDTGNISCVDNSAFASSGTIYIGTEAITYTSKPSSTAFGGTITRGNYMPFTTEAGNGLGRDHSFTSVAGGVYDRPVISDVPRLWLGRWIALYAHRIVGGVWDTVSDGSAQLVFAGRIAEIEDTEHGATLVHCADVLDTIRRTVLLHDQYTAKLSEGISLHEGVTFKAEEGYSTTFNYANDLEVKDSPSGSNEIASGVYTAEELASAISDWLLAEIQATRLDLDWSFQKRQFTDGPRMVLEVRGSGGGQFNATLFGPPDVMWFLGFEEDTEQATQSDPQAFSGIRVSGILNGTTWFRRKGNNAPARIGVAAQHRGLSRFTVAVEQAEGTWVDQRTDLPLRWQGWTSSGEEWGILSFGGSFFALARRDSATQYTIDARREVTVALGGSGLEDVGFIYDGEAGEIEIRQVMAFEKSFRAALLEFLASTGAGHNETSEGYDSLGAQLGAAIPWSLLGSSLDVDLESIDADTNGSTIMVIEKPTRLEELVASDLLIRGAYLVWKNGVVRCVQPVSPNQSLAVHAFTENNKAGSEKDAQRTSTQITSEFLVNVLKIAYNRASVLGGDEYRNIKIYKHAASISDHGESKPFTINARNSYGQFANTGQNVEQLASQLVDTTLPLYARPLGRFRRTIDFTFFENVAPGDLCTVTDNHARDPDTGARGLSGKPGMILSHRYSWGGDEGALFGEVDILFLPFDTAVPYSPTAHIDETATGAGYEADTDIDGNSASGKSRITFREHEYSRATPSEEDQDVSHFAVNDEVRIVQIDHTTKASPQTWTATIEAVDAADNQCQLDTNLAGFDTTGATLYVMHAQIYSNAQATQRSKAFQADDADFQIEDLRDAYGWGKMTSSIFTITDDDHYARENTYQDGDGAPLTTFTHTNAAIFCNQMIDYRAAVSLPIFIRDGLPLTGPTGADYEMRLVFPYYFGPGNLASPGGLQNPSIYRAFGARPLMATSNATDTVYCRVTLSLFPPAGDSDSVATFTPPYKQATFSTSSATYAYLTADEIEQVGAQNTGHGFITVEMAGESGHAATALIRGLTLWQKKRA